MSQAQQDSYAVFGNPVQHSKSPQIHQAFAQQTAQDLSYNKQLVELEQFEQTAQTFFHGAGRGLNITVPFKTQAYEFADQLNQRARQAGAVNTLIKQADGSVVGDNTDGVGMLRDISDNLGWQLKGKTVLVLGAGGAVRGILAPLLAHRPKHLVIANRTVTKAVQLATGFKKEAEKAGCKIIACGFDDLDKSQFDVVINGTAASLAGDLPPLPETLLADSAACYDMMYGAQPTVFMQWASTHGALQVADGLGMLVEQAAESFYLWRGVRPETASVIAQLRAELKS